MQMSLDGCTLDEIGKELGVTRERVRQIEAKAYRILRKPSLRRRLELGNEYMQLLQEQKDAQAEYDLELLRATASKKIERAKKLDDIKADIKDIRANTDKLRDNVTPDVADMDVVMTQTPLNELDLSVRSYNCLARHFRLEDIACPTAYDVSRLSLNDLMGVRNLGRKSLEEIANVMYKLFGFDFR